METNVLESAQGSGTSLALSNGIFRLSFARRVTDALLADIPHDEWCRQVVPGTNHALWLAGHLVVTDDFFLTAVGGRPSRLPQGWKELFGTGTKPVAGLAAYPGPAAVQEQMAELRGDLIAWFQSLGEAELLAPLPEGLGMYAANVVELMPSIAWHEGYHAGQIGLIRRSLGLGPKFG